MNSLKWSLVMVAVAVVGAVAGYGWATRNARDKSVNSPAHTAAVAEAPKTAGRVLYYRDPMRPELKFDKPGKSPFMNMELEPVYADTGADTGGVAISAHARQSLGIRVGRVERATVAPHATAVGSVTYDEHDLALVQARVGGYVAHLHVRAVLDRVRRGQVLVDITSPAWIEAQGEYLALLRSESFNDISLREATRQQLTALGIPEGAILELERTRSVPKSTALLAPIDGVVTELGLREGATFEPSALLFRINGTKTVWVNAQLPEAEARMVRPGSIVEIRAAAQPGETFKGRVQSILPQTDPATHTIGVRVAISNSAGQLSPGMFVEAALVGEAGPSQLWVPSEAVIATGERNVVIRVNDGNRFDVVNVTLGTEAEGKTAILSGLAEGQAIVLSGQFLIDSEASLRSAFNRLGASSSKSAGSIP
jgi:Cu(I)/Ag(I) efflux system membrane fusion protein